jgi:hypothetical protein
MTKVRRIDFYPDEWLAGTARLKPMQVAVYITACAMIYSHGEAVEREDLRLTVGCPGRAFEDALAHLLKLGKLVEEGTRIDSKRCATELQKSRERIAKAAQDGRKGGRPRKNPNGLEKGSGFFHEKPTNNHQPSEESGSSTESLEPREESANAPPPPKSAPAPLHEGDAPGVGYAFVGRVIRLTSRDFERWRRTYHTIPDMTAELQSADDFYARLEPEERKHWFHRCSKRLNNIHQRILETGTSGGLHARGQRCAPLTNFALAAPLAVERFLERQGGSRIGDPPDVPLLASGRAAGSTGLATRRLA